MILLEGRGVPVNKQAGIEWLQRAADEGVDEAKDYLQSMP